MVPRTLELQDDPGRDAAAGAPAGRWVARLGEALVDLVLPADCLVCAVPGTRLCPACAGGLEDALSRPRRAEQGALALPLGEDGAPLPVVAAAAYAPPVSTALLDYKDHGALHLAGRLAEALARAVAAARLDPGIIGARRALLVPVPGSAAGFMARGYDPLQELTARLPAGWVRRDLVLGPGPVASAARLWAGRGQAAHAGAGIRGRRVRDRRWRPRPGRVAPGTPVLLVDDVLTTGSTLAALSASVRRAGAVPVGAAVVAAVAPPAPADPLAAIPGPGRDGDVG